MTIYPAQSGNVTPDSLVHNGKPQKLVVAGKVEGGTLQYFIGKDAPLREADWEDDIPTATDAGKYTVWYRVKGDANHNDSDPASVVAKIAKAPISPTLSISGWTYGDEADAPALKGNPGKGAVTFQYSDAKKSTKPTKPTSVHGGCATAGRITSAAQVRSSTPSPGAIPPGGVTQGR